MGRGGKTGPGTVQHLLPSLAPRWVARAALAFLLFSFASLGSRGHGVATAAGTAPVVGGSLSGVQIFPPDNPWNVDISNAPVDPNSARLVQSIGLTTALHPDFGTFYNGRPWGIPFVTVSGSQPKVPIHFTQWPGESDPGPYPVPPDAPVEGGPNGSGDRHVIVVDRDNQKLYELFNAFPNGSGWNASCGAVFDLRSNAVRPEGWTSADAAGLPILPGLVRYEEAVEWREIRHALRFTATRTRRAYVYPARHYASTLTDPNLPSMGTRVRLKASFDISGFPPTAQVILKALKRYGMILADNGGNWFLSGAPDPRWNDAEIDTLKRVRGSDFEVIQLGYPGPPTSTRPSAPTGVQAAPGSGRVTLTWNGSTGASSYTIRRSTSSSGGYSVLASGVNATSYVDSDVTGGTTYYYTVAAVGSGGESAPSQAVSATPGGSNSGSGTPVHRLNCGGGSYSSASAGAWSGDQYAVGGATFGYGSRDLTGTTDEPLFLRVRYGTNFSYQLPVTPGAYLLRLYFAECWFTSGGNRRFDVSVNGTPVLTNLDVAGEAGGGNRLLVREVPVSTSGSQVTVAFRGVLGDAVVNALELLKSGGGQSPPPPSAPSNLRATAGSGRVDLSWTGSAGATGYTVRRAVSGGNYAPLATGLTTTTYADLSVTNGTSYQYVVTATGPGGESPASSPASATPAAAPSGGTTLRINCGGLGFTDSAGQVWLADQLVGGGTRFTYTPREILGTQDDYRYYTVRFSEGANFGFTLPATPGAYTLKLHFAECWFTAPGGRIFNVWVNGTRVLQNFDVVAAGGSNAAVIRTFPVTAGSNGVTIQLENVRNGPVISAIELLPAG